MNHEEHYEAPRLDDLQKRVEALEKEGADKLFVTLKLDEMGENFGARLQPLEALQSGFSSLSETITRQTDILMQLTEVLKTMKDNQESLVSKVEKMQAEIANLYESDEEESGDEKDETEENAPAKGLRTWRWKKKKTRTKYRPAIQQRVPTTCAQNNRGKTYVILLYSDLRDSDERNACHPIGS